MKALTSKFGSVLALLCLAGLPAGGGRCEADPLPLKSTNAAAAAAPAGGAVRSITLPHFEPEMPAARGRGEFVEVCVSCHSARYITMQPRFPRHQWEETVGKMIKAYGAHADTNQVRAIVDYLVAINGVEPTNPAADSLPGSGALDLAAGTNLLPRADAAPLLAVAGNVEEHSADVRRGAEVFAQDCAACHGVAGRGDGVVSQVLLPKPENLAAAQFSVALLSQVLWNGVPGTSMPSWRDLPQRDLNGLVAYVQTLHPPARPDQAAPETSARGRTLFQQACAVCHGTLGDGKSDVAATLVPPPTNLTWEQPDFDYVLQVLRDGIPGTGMPDWKNQLAETDQMALAGFVRSLYEPPKPGEK